MLAEGAPHGAWRFGPLNPRTSDEIDARRLAAIGSDPEISYNAQAHLVRSGCSFLFPAVSLFGHSLSKSKRPPADNREAQSCVVRFCGPAAIQFGTACGCYALARYCGGVGIALATCGGLLGFLGLGSERHILAHAGAGVSGVTIGLWLPGQAGKVEDLSLSTLLVRQWSSLRPDAGERNTGQYCERSIRSNRWPTAWLTSRGTAIENLDSKNGSFDARRS